MKYDVIIIGGGITGSAINYELSKYKIKTLQLEKRPYFANETTAGNSGYIHGGFDAKPNSLSALANIEGAKLWYKEIFKDIEFSREKIDSLVLAFNKEEEKEIKTLYERGIKNGVDKKWMSIIEKDKIIKLEPKISKKVKKALHFNNSWMINPVQAATSFIGVALQNGNKALNSSEVTKISKSKGNNLFYVQINDQKTFTTKYLINAAGHYGDKISEMIGGDKYKLDTRRGQYLILSHSERSKIKNVCFKVPTIHGKGVVVAPGLDGRVQVGPTAHEGVPKDETRFIDKQIWKDVENIGKDLIPSIDYSRVELVLAGSRAIYKPTNDFYIKEDDTINNFIHVTGIKSPGIAGSPYIAKMVCDIIKNNGQKLIPKDNFNPKYKII